MSQCLDRVYVYICMCIGGSEMDKRDVPVYPREWYGQKERVAEIWEGRWPRPRKEMPDIGMDSVVLYNSTVHWRVRWQL